jgi:hypothetical protein
VLCGELCTGKNAKPPDQLKKHKMKMKQVELEQIWTQVYVNNNNNSSSNNTDDDDDDDDNDDDNRYKSNASSSSQSSSQHSPLIIDHQMWTVKETTNTLR